MVHGGGFAPYQAGRWQHGWHVRPEPQVNIKEPPEAAIRSFYFDTILHGRPALEFLVATFGASHVLLGSDYPYDMGTFECARQVKALSIPEADRATILGGLAEKLLEVRSSRVNSQQVKNYRETDDGRPHHASSCSRSARSLARCFTRPS